MKFSSGHEKIARKINLNLVNSSFSIYIRFFFFQNFNCLHQFVYVVPMLRNSFLKFNYVAASQIQTATPIQINPLIRKNKKPIMPSLLSHSFFPLVPSFDFVMIIAPIPDMF